jgi:hypothetical protein
MLVALLLGAAVLLVLGFGAAKLLERRRAASEVIGRVLDTRPAEDAAADTERKEGQREAGVVLRSSDNELRRDVEDLAARGRAGK